MVSDIIKSFTTNYEINEFDKVCKHIGLVDGIPVEIIILLSKIDQPITKFR